MQSWTHSCCYNQKRQTGRAGSTAVRTAAGSAPPCFTSRADMASTTSDRQAKGKGQPGSTPKGKLNPNKDPPLPDHLKTGISEIEECETPVLPEHFVVVDDLRYVLPYHFDFRLHAKKRMVGVPIVDLFSSEFPVRPRCEPGIPPRLMPILSSKYQCRPAYRALHAHGCLVQCEQQVGQEAHASHRVARTVFKYRPGCHLTLLPTPGSFLICRDVISCVRCGSCTNGLSSPGLVSSHPVMPDKSKHCSRA